MAFFILRFSFIFSLPEFYPGLFHGRQFLLQLQSDRAPHQVKKLTGSHLSRLRFLPWCHLQEALQR